jgi:hypothetical protein
MTPREIERLLPGPETDATIEAEVFGCHVVARSMEKVFVVTAEIDNNGNPLPTRSPREFSTSPDEALKILHHYPGWQMWRDYGVTKANLNVKLRSSHVTINGIGTDQLFCMAICKAALNLEYMIKEFQEELERRQHERA